MKNNWETIVVDCLEEKTTAEKKIFHLLNLIEEMKDHFPPLNEEQQNSFLDLFLCDDPVEKKIETLTFFNPYKIGIQGTIQLVEILRKQCEGLATKTNELLKKQQQIDHYYGIFGTGGDKHKNNKINTLNISTISAIVAGGLFNENHKPRCPIIKVGSLAVTSNIGASNFMSHFRNNYRDENNIIDQLTRFGFVFLAPGDLNIPYQPHLLKARQELFKKGICDIIKIVCPAACLMNPFKQITGVSDPRFLPFIIAVFDHLISNSLMEEGVIVYSYEGVDELYNRTLLLRIKRNETIAMDIEPEMFGLLRCNYQDIREENNLIEQGLTSLAIFQGAPTIAPPLMDMIVWNSALLLDLAEPTTPLQTKIASIKEAIYSGKIYQNFENYLKFQPS